MNATKKIFINNELVDTITLDSDAIIREFAQANIIKGHIQKFDRTKKIYTITYRCTLSNMDKCKYITTIENIKI